MNPVSISNLVLKRIVDGRLLLLSIFGGITIATTLVAAAPVYLTALERLALDISINGMQRPFSNINVFGSKIRLTAEELDRSERTVKEGFDRYLGPIYDRHETYLLVGDYLAGMPDNPLPSPGAPKDEANRAYFRTYSNLERHIKIVDGRMATDHMETGLRGPLVEAVIGPKTAKDFNLRVDDLVIVTPDPSMDTRVSARIVGIIDADDPSADYWLPHPSLFLDPPEIDIEEGEPDDTEFDASVPPAPLFVTHQGLVQGVGQAFPNTLLDAVWFMLIDKEGLKSWSISEIRERLDAYELEISREMPGSDVGTSMSRMFNDFEKRNFFSRVPLLVLIVVTFVTVLFYLSMVVSYLAQSRDSDVALLKTRGGGALQFLRLYALEGVALTAVAAAIAPFLALGGVAAAGKLPYFRSMTDGELLPVRLGPEPFIYAGGAALLCLMIFVSPGLVSARGALLMQKLRSSRPPTSPFYHRYHVDVALLSLGGLMFWELYSRGHIISGGLFGGVDVNESLLLAPVLFMLVVALVFLRFFPLLLRLLTGESPMFVHLAAGASLVTLGTVVAFTAIRDERVTALALPAVLLLSAGGMYWATQRAVLLRYRVGGLVAQAALIAAFVVVVPLDPDSALFAPTIGLLSVVPFQVLFFILRALGRVTPFWLSMGLRNMARNPLQYTWLMLLVVLVTGLGVLSTTVGGTLERSQRERVLYEVGADIRISGLDIYASGRPESLRQSFLTIPGITSASLAFRDRGGTGSASFELLGLEPGEFPYISWYRDDFSESSLTDVMRALGSHSQVTRLRIPDGASTVGLWARPMEAYPQISMYAVIEDSTGMVSAISIGRLRQPDWQLLRATVPTRLKHPLHLVSVQIFEVGGPPHSPGRVLVDDIHVTVGPGNTVDMLDDFEDSMSWVPIEVPALTSNRISWSAREAHGGEKAGLFVFGQESQTGIRGFYRSPTGDALPVVISNYLAQATEREVGDNIVLQVRGRLVEAVIRDTIDNFPTMRAGSAGFVLADMKSLLAHLNILRPGFDVSPNEVFVTESVAARETVREELGRLTRFSGEVYDKAMQLEAVSLDPLTVAGWRAMILFSLGVAVLSAALGYATYLLAFASRSRSVMGYLQSMGLSRHQLMGLLGFEHMAVAVMGIALGTWTGFQTSRLMVTSVAVTERGDQIVPPLILMTDWSLMLPTYLLLIGVFVASLLVLNRSVQGLDLRSISRVEGF